MSIKIEHLNYIYSPGTAYERQALKDICLEIPHGEFVGIIGHTGSGKSTLIQHLNGLVRATSGRSITTGKTFTRKGMTCGPCEARWAGLSVPGASALRGGCDDGCVFRPQEPGP